MPAIAASITENWVYGTDVLPDATVTVEILDDIAGNLLWAGTAQSYPGGTLYLESDVHGVDLLAGMLVMAEGPARSGSTVAKYLELAEGLAVTSFDIVSDISRGIAPAAADTVTTYASGDLGFIVIDVPVIGGEWEAHFGGPPWWADLTPDSGGGVWLTDEDGDRTFILWEPNRPPVCGGARASVEPLWPPNHKYWEITITGVADPDGESVAITINGIYQDEAVDAKGCGNTAPDARGVGTSIAEVRAERSGREDGRVYHIFFTADDGNGASCSSEVLVGVPHDKKDTAVDGGALFDSTLNP